MKQSIFIGYALAALLLPLTVNAQDEPKKPVEQPDRQKLREQFRNLSPEERQAKLRELREQGVLPAEGQGQRPFQGQAGMQPGMGPGGVGAIMRVLTPEQRESLREANQANQEKTRELEEKLRDARKAVLEATLEPKFNEDNLRKKLEAAAKLDTELTILRARTLSKVEPPLSEEQIQQIKSAPVGGNMPQRFQGQGQRPGRGGPDAMPGEPLPFGNQPLPPPVNK